MTARSKHHPLLLLALLLPGMAGASEDAAAWLDRMNHALHALSYEGRFVYQHGQTLEAMYLSHEVIGGQERERLMSLTGTAREVIRDDEAVTCVVSGPKSAQVDRRPSGRNLAPVQVIRPERLADYYRFELGGRERVAGRMAQTVSIIPRDDLRFGYWLLLDTEHALPLAAATLDSAGTRISQLLFTDLQVGEADGPAPSVAQAGGEVIRSVRPARVVEPDLQPRWRFAEPPGGFAQSRYRRRVMGSDDHEVEHFIFSDGLATVSVYIEAERNPGYGPGVSRLGAVTALRRNVAGYQVTAVGEVPEVTLQRFLDGIEPIPGAP